MPDFHTLNIISHIVTGSLAILAGLVVLARRKRRCGSQDDRPDYPGPGHTVRLHRPDRRLFRRQDRQHQRVQSKISSFGLPSAFRLSLIRKIR